MQISVTNLTQVSIPLNVGAGSPYALQAGVTATITLPDSEQDSIVALRAAGKISFSYVVLPNKAADLQLGRVGRTEVAAAAYLASASDFNNVVECSQACTLTLPANAPRGATLSILQTGAGKVIFAVGAGGTLRIPGSATGTNGQWTMASAFVRDNPGGAAAEWVVAGNVA